MLRRDSNQSFFSYGFDPDKSSVLYSTTKQKIPDAFISTAFCKHYSEIINERREKVEFSTLFYYLPSITDRKETINLHKNNVNLTPVDCLLPFIECFASKKGTSFDPQLSQSIGIHRLKCCMGYLDKLLNREIITRCVVRIIF